MQELEREILGYLEQGHDLDDPALNEISVRIWRTLPENERTVTCGALIDFIVEHFADCHPTNPPDVIVSGRVALPLPVSFGTPNVKPKVISKSVLPDGMCVADVEAPARWWQVAGWIKSNPVAWRLRIDSMALPMATKKALLQLADDAEPDS